MVIIRKGNWSQKLVLPQGWDCNPAEASVEVEKKKKFITILWSRGGVHEWVDEVWSVRGEKLISFHENNRFLRVTSGKQSERRMGAASAAVNSGGSSQFLFDKILRVILDRQAIPWPKQISRTFNSRALRYHRRLGGNRFFTYSNAFAFQSFEFH